MRIQSATLPAAILLTALLGAACSETHSRSRYASETVHPDGQVELNLNGLTFEISSELEYASERDLTLDSSQWSPTIGGHALRVDGQELMIGSTGYGQAAAGDHVRIDTEGVFVNDEHRGEVPPS